ncbi:hypothetical protein BGY98DRAFT_1043538 [Russula aff. rugulosa BPL654]|nr:hypothetical protein BGY98DRAFT_1043538 [Russula aff. rugulosa BPL654]
MIGVVSSMKLISYTGKKPSPLHKKRLMTFQLRRSPPGTYFPQVTFLSENTLILVQKEGSALELCQITRGDPPGLDTRNLLTHSRRLPFVSDPNATILCFTLSFRKVVGGFDYLRSASFWVWRSSLYDLIPGAWEHHKGPRWATLAKRKSSQKQWLQRREQLFATTPSTGAGSGPHSTGQLQQLPTERSRDNRVQEEKMAVLEWACKVVIEYPYDDPEEGRRNVVEETPLVRCLLFWAILHSLCTHPEEHMQAQPTFV